MKLEALTIGVTPAWQQLLHQIGIATRALVHDAEIPDSPAVVIVLSTASADNLNALLRAGSAILTTARIAAETLTVPAVSRRIHYATQPAIMECDSIYLPFLNRKLLVPADGQFCRDQRGRALMRLEARGNGWLMTIPEGLGELIFDTSIARRHFQPPGGSKLITERVSSISKGGIRQLIEQALRILYNALGLPFVRKWHLPKGLTAAYGFRIDTDFGSESDLDALYRVCTDHDVHASWFVETKSAETYVNIYGKMDGQEIGYHCYRHRTFSDPEQNRADMETGLAILRKAGIHPHGYAAPFGEWNQEAGAVIEEKGFRYSSEFGYAYDSWPFFPRLGNRTSKVLQVPIHPMSFGFANGEQQILNYYRRVMSAKLDNYEPFFFYHHPPHRRLDLFASLFAELNAHGIPCLRMNEYALWWEKRLQSEPIVSYQAKQLFVEPGNSDASIYLLAVFPGGERLLGPANAEGSFADNCRSIAPPGKLPYTDPSVLQRWHWKCLLKDLEFHWGKRKH